MDLAELKASDAWYDELPRPVLLAGVFPSRFVPDVIRTVTSDQSADLVMDQVDALRYLPNIEATLGRVQLVTGAVPRISHPSEIFPYVLMACSPLDALVEVLCLIHKIVDGIEFRRSLSAVSAAPGRSG